jgi:serine O-acetyltransferase
MKNKRIFFSPCETLSALQEQAKLLASEEVVLSDFLDQAVLKNRSLGECFAAVLSRQLECERMLGTSLCGVMSEIFLADESAIEFATEDLWAVVDRDPACPNLLHALLNLKGFHSLLAYRATHCLWNNGRQRLAYIISSLACSKLGVDIHPAARIGKRVMFDHGTGIVIGETSVIEDDVSVLQGVTLGGTGKEAGDRHPKVRRGVLIGAGAKILGNIEIGAMSKVAAGSVVLRGVPPKCTVAGVPAKVVKYHEPEQVPAFDMQ